MKTLAELNALAAEWMALESSDPHAQRVIRDMEEMITAGHISISRDGTHANIMRGNQPQFIGRDPELPYVLKAAREMHPPVRTDVAWHPDGKWIALSPAA